MTTLQFTFILLTSFIVIPILIGYVECIITESKKYDTLFNKWLLGTLRIIQLICTILILIVVFGITYQIARIILTCFK